jgi:hypothetical protein
MIYESFGNVSFIDPITPAGLHALGCLRQRFILAGLEYIPIVNYDGRFDAYRFDEDGNYNVAKKIVDEIAAVNLLTPAGAEFLASLQRSIDKAGLTFEVGLTIGSKIILTIIDGKGDDSYAAVTDIIEGHMLNLKETP